MAYDDWHLYCRICKKRYPLSEIGPNLVLILSRAWLDAHAKAHHTNVRSDL